MDFVVVKDIVQGIERTKEFLYDEVDRKTALFLSGGRTPRELYKKLATDQIITAAAVGMIDERYGLPLHENSNERMVKDSGFLGYLEKQNIPFYSMLSPKLSSNSAGAKLTHPKGGSQKLAEEYDQTVRDLFFKFPKSIGIIGIGDDGHIASIFPNRKDFKNPLFEESRKYDYASAVDDLGKYGQRISLTFAGLSLLDFYIVFVFGKDKKKALKKALSQGPLEEIPARFFQQSEISQKTLFITDQKI